MQDVCLQENIVDWGFSVAPRDVEFNYGSLVIRNAHVQLLSQVCITGNSPKDDTF